MRRSAVMLVTLGLLAVGPHATAIGKTVLMVLRADFQTGTDTFRLHVDPMPGEPEPALPDAVKSDTDVGTVDGIGTFSSGAFSFDEIRVGQSYSDVVFVPEPSTLEMLAVAALGVLIWFRGQPVVKVSCLLAGTLMVGCAVYAADPPGKSDEEPIQKPIEGLWSGPWGGGGSGGVMFQPVMAELFIQGNHVELHGFPKVKELTGTVRFDANTRQMRITPKTQPGGRPAKTLVYTCEIKADELVLTDTERFSISLQRHPAVRSPMADVRIGLVTATGINDAGELVVTEFTVLRAGRAGTTYYEPSKRLLKTEQATVLRILETGCRKITLDEARQSLRRPTTVAVAYYWSADRSKRQPPRRLWQDTGLPPPDHEAVFPTYTRALRPGTLVFVLSARENVPEP